MNEANKFVCYITVGPKGLLFKKHSSLLALFLSYEENEVLWVWAQGLYSRNYSFSVTQEWGQELLEC